MSKHVSSGVRAASGALLVLALTTVLSGCASSDDEPSTLSSTPTSIGTTIDPADPTGVPGPTAAPGTSAATTSPSTEGPSSEATLFGAGSTASELPTDGGGAGSATVVFTDGFTLEFALDACTPSPAGLDGSGYAVSDGRLVFLTFEGGLTLKHEAAPADEIYSFFVAGGIHPASGVPSEDFYVFGGPADGEAQLAQAEVAETSLRWVTDNVGLDADGFIPELTPEQEQAVNAALAPVYEDLVSRSRALHVAEMTATCA